MPGEQGTVEELIKRMAACILPLFITRAYTIRVMLCYNQHRQT